jgi:Ni,Fe-hydrogenase III small subunit
MYSVVKLTETGRCYGAEMNVEKTKVIRFSRQRFPVKIYDKPKTSGECGIF